MRRVTLCGWVLSLELLELGGWLTLRGWVLSSELLSGLLALARSLVLEKSLAWLSGSWSLLVLGVEILFPNGSFGLQIKEVF